MNLTISENVNDIIFNGYYVQKLIFNRHEVWNKGIAPVQKIDYLNPHVDTEYYYNYTMSGQNSSWQSISLSNSYQQYNFVDCTDSNVSLGDPDCDYGDVKILIFCSNSSNSKYIPDSSYVGKVKISELIPATYVDGLRDAILIAENNNIGVYTTAVRDAILAYYNTVLSSNSLYANQIRDAFNTVGNFMQKKNSNYSLPSAYLAQPDIVLTNANNTKYYIDDSQSGQISGDTKVRIILNSGSTEWYYNAANSDYYVCPWYSILIMIYNYYWLKYLNESSVTRYNISVSSNNDTYGTVDGSRQYFENSTCTLNATVTSIGTFDGWYENNTLVSTSNPYSFTVTSNRTLQGRFSERTQYTVTVSSEDITKGTVSGGGTYYDGNEVTVTGTSNEGYVVEGWYINNMLVSDANPYTFTVTGNTSLVCKFKEGTAYTQVSYIKPTTANSYNYKTIYFDTGIKPIPEYTLGNNTYGEIELIMQFYMTGGDGNVFFGNMGNPISGNQNDSYDFRLFLENYLMLDVGNGRAYSSATQYRKANMINKAYNYTWYSKLSNTSSLRQVSLKNTGGSTFYSFQSFANLPNNNNIYICLGYMKFKSLIINKNGVKVFDGVAALDSSNVPCIYDSVSDTLIYASGTNANNITYES